MTVRLRVPPSCDLVLEPQLGPIVLLEIAAVVTANALRGQYVQIEGDALDDEIDEISSARILAGVCDALCVLLRDYRDLVLARLQREQAAHWAE